jgi:hypothetical protein
MEVNHKYGRCKECGGTGRSKDFKACPWCCGCGFAPLKCVEWRENASADTRRFG